VKSAVAGDAKEVIEHGAADSAPTGCLGDVHRLELPTVIIELLESPDAEQLTVDPDAEERDGRVEETVDLEGVHVLWRAVRVGEGEMALQERTDILSPGVIDRDLEFSHRRRLPRASVSGPSRKPEHL
jgi:hypothetical protein